MRITLSIGDRVALDSASNAKAARPRIGISLLSLERSYAEPATLTLAVYGDHPPFGVDARVVLRIDDVIWFNGLLSPGEVTMAPEQSRGVMYQAQDAGAALRNPLAWYEAEGSAVDAPTIFAGERLDEQLVRFVDLMAKAQMRRVHLTTSIACLRGCGARRLPGVDVQDETIDGALRRIVAAVPGLRIMVRPAGDAYQVLPARTSPLLPLDLLDALRRIVSVRMDTALDGCAGAVQIARRSFAFQGQSGDSKVLLPAWNPALEATWTADRAQEMPERKTDLPNDRRMVFRLWRWLPDTVPQYISPGWSLHVDIRHPSQVGTGSPLRYDWQEVEIEAIDPSQRLVLLRDPAVRPPLPGRNSGEVVDAPGQAKAATARLRIVQRGQQRGWIRGVRYPTRGYAGRAAAMSPITCRYDRIVEMPPLDTGILDEALWARAAFDVVSEPVFRGTIVVGGDPLVDALGLDRRVRVTCADGRYTGLETIDASVVRVAVDFRARTTTLDFTSQLDLGDAA